jgi:hypothetical protein
LFTFSFQAEEILEALELNGPYQPLGYADNVSLLGDNSDNVEERRETLIDAMMSSV